MNVRIRSLQKTAKDTADSTVTTLVFETPLFSRVGLKTGALFSAHTAVAVFDSNDSSHELQSF